MTLTVALWVLVLVAAVAQVAATATGRQLVAAGLKIAPIIGLMALMVDTGPVSTGAGRWFLAGLVLCALGDAFLVAASDRAFLLGLASFLLGHLAYAVAFLTVGPHAGIWLVIALLVMAPLAYAGVRRILPAARRHGGAAMGGAVTAYLVVIAAMVLAAGLTGSAWLTLGALCFALSDTVLGLDRFDAARPQARPVVMGTYYLAQILLTLGMLALASTIEVGVDPG